MPALKTFTIHPANAEQQSALMAFVKALKMNFEVKAAPEYHPDFVAKIQQGLRDVENGNVTVVPGENVKDYLKSI